MGIGQEFLSWDRIGWDNNFCHGMGTYDGNVTRIFVVGWDRIGQHFLSWDGMGMGQENQFVKSVFKINLPRALWFQKK
jgi:hypothetical protein